MMEDRFDNLDVDEALRVIAEGTATTIGKSFYTSLVESLSGTLNTTGAWVTEYLRDTQRLRALAFWLNGEWIEDYEYDIEGSPCELVVTSAQTVHIPENVSSLFPKDSDLRVFQAVSYLVVPLMDPAGTVLGHLAVLDSRPMPQEGEFEPVGSSHTLKVDVRIIAATNRPLHEAVKEKSFREDLFYRLSVFPITVPPLRARGDDIRLLADVFVQKFAHKLGHTIEPISEEAARQLQAYDWPGNVRELENVMERAVIIADMGRLDFSRALPESAEKVNASERAYASAIARVLTVEDLQQLERRNIIAALDSCDWRVSGENGAAQVLVMKPSTLNSRMNALGIKRPIMRSR